ncbi:MAG: glycosyltransferase family 4 protein [Leptospiraceae bacterium]|nr:glycosyltransferase family 4 protein [Leptospiraceae bacterium]MCK6380625.1 glycosyltransferase family 4 protein [Leptospiraceae bacterium]
MKICLIVDDYLPNSIKVAAKMMHELAVEFVNLGHDVMVVTPDSRIKNKYEESILDGVKVYSFRSGEIKNVSKLKRAINESLLSYRAWSSLKEVFQKKPQDYIVYYSPSIFWGSLVWKIKNLWNVKTYLVLRDIFPQWALDNGLLKKHSIITKYFLFFEKKCYDSANTIGVMSKKNLDWFKDYYKGNAKVELLFNWAENSPVVLKSKPYRKKLGLEKKLVFFYGGNIGHAQDMSQVINLAKSMLNFPKVHFVLVGAGDEVGLVKYSIQEFNLKNMTLLSPVPQGEFKKLMAEFDVGLFCLHRNHTTHNFPGKILGYMVQGMPILGSVNLGNDLKEIIEEANAGYVSISGDEDLLLSNAKQFLKSGVIKITGKNSKKLLEKKFSVSSAAKSILNRL